MPATQARTKDLFSNSASRLSARCGKPTTSENARCGYRRPIAFFVLHSKLSLLIWSCATLLVLLPASKELQGQTDVGSIRGTVHDQRGTPLAGVKVTLTDRKASMTT